MKTSSHSAVRIGLWSTAIAALLLTAGILAACDALTPPESPIYNNPVDPGGSTFVPPTVTITGGPQTGDTVSTRSVTFTWTGSSNAILFQTRVLGHEWLSDWSPWSEDTSQTLIGLDESQYQFRVRGGIPSSSGDPQSGFISDPASRTFTVDAIQGPALWLSPVLSLASLNGNFDLNVYAEDVTDLTMVKLRIRFDAGRLQYTTKSDGPFLLSNGGTLLQFDPIIDNGAGLVEFEMGVAGANPPGVTGTGIIITLTFQAVGTGQTDVTFGLANTLLRDHLNAEITLTSQDLYGARVIVP